MKPEKPITENMKEKAAAIYRHLMREYPRYCTKEELAEVIGCKNERTVRDVVAYISLHVPIISNSATKGYKIARKLSDEEEVNHTCAELSSRNEEIEKRLQTLYAWRDKARKMRMVKNNG